MRKQAKKREIYDQDLQETNDEESEIDLNESKLKNPSENSGKNCDKVATIIYNMILKNKINSTNAFEIPLVNIKEMSDFTNIDTCSTWKNLASALEVDVKLYSYRVDSVFNCVYQVLGGLNRGLKENETKEGDQKREEEEKSINNSEMKKKPKKNDQQIKFIESNKENLNLKNFDLDFEVDPLLEKNSAKFDEGGALGLLINNLIIDKNLSLNLTTFEIIGKASEKEMSKKPYYDSFKDIGLKKPINFNKGICPELKEIMFDFQANNQEEDEAKTKLNCSEFNDLNCSQMPSFTFDESSNESMGSLNEIEEFREIEEIEAAASQGFIFSGERSFVDGIIDNFDIQENSKLNLSLCEFDDSQIGNGGKSILEFYQENEANNFWLGPDSLKIKKSNLFKEKQETKKDDKSKDKLSIYIDFNVEGKPTYLREKPLNLNQFFEDKLIEQLDPIKHSFLLPMDLNLESSRLATLFERPFFDKLNSDILKNEFQNEADFSVCKVNDEDNEKNDNENKNKIQMPILDVKDKIWKYIDREKGSKKISKKEVNFHDLVETIPEIITEKNQTCSIQTLFLSILHLANEKNLSLQNTGESNSDFKILLQN